MKNEHSIACVKNKIMPLKKQAEVQNAWLMKRLDTLLPKLMKETDMDCWLIIGRECGEDNIIKTFLPQPEDSTGRIGIFAFIKNADDTVERYSMYGTGGRFNEYYTAIWDASKGDQWHCLNELLLKKNPKNIGVNTSELTAHADGISHTNYLKLMDSLDESLKSRVCSAEILNIRWQETRIDDELYAYEGIQHIASCIMSEVFSSNFIHPGITHTSEVEWMFMEQIHALGLQKNFTTDVNVQRKGDPCARIANTIIMPGDIVRCDFGLTYLGLNTDHQRLAYVLHPGEESVPQGIVDAFKTGNKFQDIIFDCIAEGKTGNEVFTEVKEKAAQAGIRNEIYCHPIGYFVHGAGPAFGQWGNQNEFPRHGVYTVYDRTCYSIEMNITQYCPEWEQDITMCHEENAAFVDGKSYFLNARATELYLIR